MELGDFITSALSTTIGSVLRVIVEVAKAIVAIGKVLGIVDEDTNETELGEELLQSEKDGFNPEDFSSREEYLKNAKSLDIDPDIKAMSAEDKAKKATEFVSAAINEKYSGFSVENLIKCIGGNTEWFTNIRSGLFGELLKNNEGEAKNVLNYLTCAEKNSANRESALNTLVDMEKKVNPSISETDAIKNINNLRK